MPPPPDPQVLRQGGDTLADALEIPHLDHYEDTGTTVGYTDDYDEVCPYSGSTSPDVVYTFTTSPWPPVVDIDMLGSSYDTKIYVYDENLELVACNDDFYADYVSKIEALALEPETRYYLVIDGYGGDAGDYLLTISTLGGEYVNCPAGATLEDEPPLVNDYVDAHNGGCNSLDDLGYAPFQHIGSEWFCGQAGWFICDGGDCRDTDWYTLTIPPSGALEIIGDATHATYMFELGPQDCDQVDVLQSVQIGPIMEGTLIITGEPGSTAWFWVGAMDFTPPWGDPPREYDYVLNIPQVIAVEATTWSEVKQLYR